MEKRLFVLFYYSIVYLNLLQVVPQEYRPKDATKISVSVLHCLSMLFIFVFVLIVYLSPLKSSTLE